MERGNLARKKYPLNVTSDQVDETINQLAKNIKYFRELRGMTQMDLAVGIGSSISAVQQWEQATTMPGREWLTSLSNAFGVSVADLFGVIVPTKKKRK